VLKRELQTLCRASRLRCGSCASRLGAAVVLKRELRTLYRASRVKHGLRALCLSTEVVLRRGLLFLRLGIAVVLRRGLRALRLSSARVASISLTSEAWTLLSDDLYSVIFRQSTPSKFSYRVLILRDTEINTTSLPVYRDCTLFLKFFNSLTLLIQFAASQFFLFYSIF